ncbi:MAG: arylsulfatase A [Candidatus Pelagisphaera sp.]|jgi:arylsulfatase A
MIKNRFLILAVSAIACFVVSISLRSADTPNVVLIFADDLGFGDVSAYNADSKIQTPNLDKLASQGIRLADAHSASGVCTPSRYALLTGRYAWRTKLKNGVLGGFSEPLLAPDRMTLGHLFQRQGYATACVGKWHLGMEWNRPDRGDQEYDKRNSSEGVAFGQPIARGPTSSGFDYYFGISASLDMPPYVFIENESVTALPTSLLKHEDKGGREGPAVPGWRHKYVTPTIVDKTIAFIGDHREEPFFVYVPLNSPHTPHAPGDAFTGSSGLDVYGDFVVEVDYNIGRIMQAIDNLGLADDTLLIVTSDNGPETNMFGRLQNTGHDSSGALLGAKRDNWEGGHRVPFIARWPGQIRAGSMNSDPVCLVDFMATFAELLDVELPSEAGGDSVSLLPILRGGDADYREGHAIVHHSSGGLFAIRRGDWKLLLHAGSGGNAYGSKANKRRAADYAGTLEKRLFDTGDRQLYNLKLDLGETQNLAADFPEIVSRLTALAARYVLEGRSTLGPKLEYVSGDWKQIDWVE